METDLKAFIRVCLSVCVCVHTMKQNGSLPTKGQKVKVTESHIEGDRVAGVSYALYRVPIL